MKLFGSLSGARTRSKLFSVMRPRFAESEACRHRLVLGVVIKCGAQPGKLFFLPKYSPDLNPIEQVFAKLKHLLRKATARTVETICTAIGEILAAFTPDECANYFRNSGYALTYLT
jgi:transposase